MKLYTAIPIADDKEDDVQTGEISNNALSNVMRIVEKGGAGSGHWGHEGRPGKVGGSLPGSLASLTPINPDYFTRGPGRELLQEMPPAYRDLTIDAIVAGNVPASDFRGLRGVTDKLDDFAEHDAPWANRYKTWQRSGASGIHWRRTSKIYMNPQFTDTWEDTFIHELGHHFDYHNDGPWNERHQKAKTELFPELLNFYKSSNLDEADDLLGNTGLRDYSFSNDKEFMADMYKVARLGTKYQKEVLNSYLTEYAEDEDMTLENLFPTGE